MFLTRKDSRYLLDRANVASTLLNNFFGEAWDLSALPMLSNILVNVSKSKTEYLVEVAAPGFSKQDLKVEVVNGTTLNISGCSEEVEEDVKSIHREFVLEEFAREVSLGSDADMSELSASYENGILAVKIPLRNLASNSGKSVEIK